MIFLILFGALIASIWLIFFFIKKFKKIYIADNSSNLIKTGFFGWATVQAWMYDTMLVKHLFFDGKSKFIFFLDLIFILIIGFFFIKAMWLSTVPKVSDNRQSQFAKIIFISIYFLYLFGMIKVTYF
jgi:hypothetical protein|tara:strand:- start:34 stop:414 length:381 start_codon:yes stop_codon:yes gene_type:complete